MQIELPPIQTVEQVSLAMAAVCTAISEGQITPGEGQTVANVLAVQKDMIVTADLERRVQTLEERILIDYEEVK